MQEILSVCEKYHKKKKHKIGKKYKTLNLVEC